MTEADRKWWLTVTYPNGHTVSRPYDSKRARDKAKKQFEKDPDNVTTRTRDPK